MSLIRNILYSFLNVLRFLILIRAILSFFPLRSSQWYDFLITVTEPILAPIRKLLSGFSQTFDLSPIVALILIGLLQSLIRR